MSKNFIDPRDAQRGEYSGGDGTCHELSIFRIVAFCTALHTAEAGKPNTTIRIIFRKVPW
jgi:hypothetical protein